MNRPFPLPPFLFARLQLQAWPYVQFPSPLQASIKISKSDQMADER